MSPPFVKSCHTPCFAMSACAVCLEHIALSRSHALPCTHVFCVACISQWRAHGGSTCPLCRAFFCRRLMPVEATTLQSFPHNTVHPVVDALRLATIGTAGCALSLCLGTLVSNPGGIGNAMLLGGLWLGWHWTAVFVAHVTIHC
jgi:hypothetical protein